MDEDGELRCWYCGGKGFSEKRTTASKVMLGFGALLTSKRLKCQVCGSYNRMGKAAPYKGPASRKYRRAEERWQRRDA